MYEDQESERTYSLEIIIRLLLEVGYVPGQKLIIPKISSKIYIQEKKVVISQLKELYKKPQFEDCQKKDTQHWYTLYSKYLQKKNTQHLSTIPFARMLEIIADENILSRVNPFPDNRLHPIIREDDHWLRTCDCKVYTGLRPDLRKLDFEYVRYPLFFSRNQ